MDGVQYFTMALGVSLFVLGWFLSSGNWANFKAPRSSFKNQDEEALLKGRTGRRLHMSLVLTGLGAAIFVGAFLGRERVTAFYWYGVAALALWMSVLAILDGGATWTYVIRVRRKLAKKREAIIGEVAARAAQARELIESDTAESESAPRRAST
jgi:hypothetical protein